MKHLKPSLVVVLILTSVLNTVNAACLSDIYTFGLSADSYTYETEKSSEGSGKFASESAIGIKAGKIYYCPTKKMEFMPYFRLRFLELDDSGDLKHHRSVQKEYDLFSFGMDVKFLKSEKLEWIADVELREEFIIVSDGFNHIYGEKYTNLKALAGVRYKTQSVKNLHLTALGGLLIPTESDAKLGWNIEGVLEYLIALNQRHAIRPEAYYSHYQQKFGDFKSTRNEFGLRANYIFRF